MVYQHRFLTDNADLLNRLDPEQRHHAVMTLSSSAIEGLEPTRAQLEVFVRHILGELTLEEMVETARTGW